MASSQKRSTGRKPSQTQSRTNGRSSQLGQTGSKRISTATSPRSSQSRKRDQEGRFQSDEQDSRGRHYGMKEYDEPSVSERHYTSSKSSGAHSQWADQDKDFDDNRSADMEPRQSRRSYGEDEDIEAPSTRRGSQRSSRRSHSATRY